MTVGTCPKCKRCSELTRHHILPSRWWGKSGPIQLLCRSCHDMIERLIPFEQMPKKWYLELLDNFLNPVTFKEVTNE